MSKRVLVLYRDIDHVEPYRAAIAAEGLEPVLVNPEEASGLGDCAGLLLTGGSDVDPASYHEDPHPETEPADPRRDEAEQKLIAEALETDKPVLAICRGLQMVNVQAGGSLIQHLGMPEHCKRTPVKGAPAHQVEIEPDTLLAKISGRAVWDVNSRHHQAVDRLGEGLRISARSPDGIVEAIERPDSRYFLAVQWHPENQSPTDSEQRKLFRSFADAL